jgi:hypothetical protein
MNELEQDVNYINLNEVDPNYTAIPEEVYTLKVLSLKLAKAGAQAKNPGKAYVKGTFSVQDHDKFSGRRLFATFFNITEPSSRDAKDLKRLSQVTGVNQDGGFEQWLETIGQIGPSFKASVKQVDAIDYATRAVKVNEDGTPQKDNQIDFRNVQIA